MIKHVLRLQSDVVEQSKGYVRAVLSMGVTQMVPSVKDGIEHTTLTTVRVVPMNVTPLS